MQRGGQPPATIVLGGISVLVFFLTHRLTRVLAFTQARCDSPPRGYSTFGPFLPSSTRPGGWSLVHSCKRNGGGSSRAHSCTSTCAPAVQHAGDVLARSAARALRRAVRAGGHLCRVAHRRFRGAMLHRPEAAVVGASGAVYGLLGAAYVVEYLRGGNPLARRARQPDHRQRDHLVPDTRHLHRRPPRRIGGRCAVRLRSRRHQPAPPPPTLAERLSTSPSTPGCALAGGGLGTAGGDRCSGVRSRTGGCTHLARSALLSRAEAHGGPPRCIGCRRPAGAAPHGTTSVGAGSDSRLITMAAITATMPSASRMLGTCDSHTSPISVACHWQQRLQQGEPGPGQRCITSWSMP